MRSEAVAARNTTITVDATLAEAYNAAPKVKKKKAQSAMWRVLRAASSGKTRTKSPDLSPQEARLILKVHSNLPNRKRKRYHKLIEKSAAGTLTTQEHAEVLGVVEEAEEAWGARNSALAAG